MKEIILLLTNGYWGTVIMEVYTDKILTARGSGEYWDKKDGCVNVYGSQGGTGIGFRKNEQDIRISEPNYGVKFKMIQWDEKDGYYYPQNQSEIINNIDIRPNIYI